MIREIEIYCENDCKNYSFPLGTPLKKMAEFIKPNLEGRALGAFVNNKLKEMSFEIFHPKKIKFIDLTNRDGIRMYVRSITFVLYKAVKDLYPEGNISLEHSISKGFYCTPELPEKLTSSVVNKIKKQMQSIIKQNLSFIRTEMRTEKAREIYRKNKLSDKDKLFSFRTQFYTSVYSLGETINYFHGHLVPSTGYLENFDLVHYYDGILLKIPQNKAPFELEPQIKQDKLFEILQEHKKWVKILEIPNVATFNELVENNGYREIIKISEALQEKKVAKIADIIYKKKDRVKLVLISGPSSSGKTSFSKKLGIQLRVLGLKPLPLSLDNYFVERTQTPVDEKGQYDFENLQALDLELFNNNLLDLLDKKPVKLPKFDFNSGSKIFAENETIMQDDNILVIEGIHALNPKLIYKIDPSKNFKIYVSALTQISIDNQNRISTTDNRLLRRIVRDYKYRNYSAQNTIKQWPSVNRGENKNIFPYQENADIMFNSALPYEFGVLKKYAKPLLNKIDPDCPEYAEATRILKFLSYFLDIESKDIPPTSIIREFLGGSSFKY